MIRTILRLTSSMGLALCLGLAFTPLGCGGSQGMGMESTHGAGEGPQAPAEAVAQLTECANDGRARLTETAYDFQFEVEVTESGNAGRVKLRDSYPGERGLETCMIRALEGMPVPLSVSRMLSAQAVSPEARGPMGNVVVLAAGGTVALAPIFIVAAGVTLGVFVVLSVSKEAVEAARRRSKIKKQCMEWQVECLEHPEQPEWNRGILATGRLANSVMAGA